MSKKPLDILKDVWGHQQFRPAQESIIDSVLSGKDTLALLPTGGGKSICFQVPALCLEGICLVVSPLIALMKDQVENLRQKGIKAAAIYSGMSLDEIDLVIDNCLYGDYKFLYLSPERLLSEKMMTRIARMKVSLIAIDEAHCISQWGYDFRPPYLEIFKIRESHPKAPILALTATATPEVQSDIMKRLEFKTENLFKVSFTRKNLSYRVYKPDDKIVEAVSMIKQLKGSAIVYVRNRKKTKEISDILQSEGITSTFYHAGLPAVLRTQRQDDWKSNKVRVMVSTNAFGMGIDKPDVQSVFHLDLPDDLESYYQEAGRAGRNEKPAFAILLYQDRDVNALLSKSELQFPDLQEIRSIYKGLCNYLQIPIGGGMGNSYDFDIASFIDRYQLHPLKTSSAIRVLENEGFISLSENIFIPSKIHFTVSPTELYRFQVSNHAYDRLIKLILRSCEGVFEDYVRINESELADRTGIPYKELTRMLEYLEKISMMRYVPRKDAPQLTFCIPREDSDYLGIDLKSYRLRKERFIKRAESMAHYTTTLTRCRSNMLVSYFGETPIYHCGICDYCKRSSASKDRIETHQSTISKILVSLESGPATIISISNNLQDLTPEQIQDLIRNMMESGLVQIDSTGMVHKL
jgi:ATP-dependent DNA helicase RecQ